MVAALAACSGGAGTIVAPITATPTPTAAPQLSAASASGCVYAGTAQETTAIPTAGGVSGTITLGPVAASTSCLKVTVATLSDATPGAAARHGRAARDRDAALPQPLVQISLTDTYTGNLTWAFITVQLPTGTIPAGMYVATITSTTYLGDGQTSTSTANFTVTVDATGKAIITGPSGVMALAVLAADTTGVLSLYPPGTVLPTPTPFETATPTPGPTGSPTASPVATATPTPTVPPSGTPTPRVTPTPNASATFAPTIVLNPSACTAVGNAGGTLRYTAQPSQTAPPGETYEYLFSASDHGSWKVVQGDPTMSSYYGTLGPNPDVTVTIPKYPQGDLAGEGAYVYVTLFLADGSGGLGHVEDSQGNYIAAHSPIAAGTSTCAGF